MSFFVHKFGANSAVSTTLLPVAEGGIYRMPSVIQSLELVSDDANDTGSGTGARTIQVEGLSTLWAKTIETVTLNGTTPVALANQYFRVFRMKVMTSGTYGNPNAGAGAHSSTITLQESGAGDIWSTIDVDAGMGLGQTKIAFYSAAQGEQIFVRSKNVSIESNKDLNVYLCVREGASTVTAPFSAFLTKEFEKAVVGTFSVDLSPKGLGPYVGPCDVGFMARTTIGSADMSLEFIIETNKSTSI